MSEISEDQNYSVDVESASSTTELKQLQVTLQAYNKQRKYLIKKMDEESKLWNNKLKELTKYIEMVAHYEKKRELTKKTIKKERHIRNIVRRKRLQRLKAMAELRESDRIQYQKEERLHRKLLNRPHRPSPVIVAITRKLKDAKTKRDILGKETDALRSNILEIEAQLNLIKIKPLREKIKQLKTGTIAEEINNPVAGTLAQCHSQTFDEQLKVMTKQKHEASVMNVAIESIKKKSKGKEKTLKKIHLKRSKKILHNPDEESGRIATKKQAFFNDRKFEHPSSSKILHKTKEYVYRNKSKDVITQGDTRNKKSKTKISSKRKSVKGHRKTKLRKINSIKNDTNLTTMNIKSEMINYTENITENITSMAAQDNTELKLPITVDLKQLNVNTISRMVLAPSTIDHTKTIHNINEKFEQQTLAKEESTETIKPLKKSIEETTNIVKDNKASNRDYNTPLGTNETQLMNSSVNDYGTLKMAQSINHNDSKLLQTQIDNSIANRPSSLLVTKLSAAFTERDLNQQFDELILKNDAIRQTNSLTNVLYFKGNRHKGARDIRQITNVNDYHNTTNEIYHTSTSNLLLMASNNNSSNGPYNKRCQPYKAYDSDYEIDKCKCECTHKLERTIPAYDKAYFRRLLKQELESTTTADKASHHSTMKTFFKGKLYDIMRQQLHGNDYAQTIAKPTSYRYESIILPKTSSAHRLQRLYNNLDENLGHKLSPKSFDIKST